MRKTYIIFAVIIGLVITPALLFAQTDNSEDGSLEQITPEEMQMLEDTLQNIQQGASVNQYAAPGNDFQLDVVWSANTFIPYDYPGKALPGALSGITFYAIANVANPQELVYTWLVDDASSSRDGPDQTGLGRSTFNYVTFQIPQFTHKMRVMAQDPKTEKSAAISIELKTAMPEAYFYLENNRIYSKAETNIIKLSQNSEKNMMVRIFNINAQNINNINFKWYVNNILKDNTEIYPEIIPLRVAAGIPIGSQTNLKLEAANKRDKSDDLSQKAVTRASVYIAK